MQKKIIIINQAVPPLCISPLLFSICLNSILVCRSVSNDLVILFLSFLTELPKNGVTRGSC